MEQVEACARGLSQGMQRQGENDFFSVFSAKFRHAFDFTPFVLNLNHDQGEIICAAP